MSPPFTEGPGCFGPTVVLLWRPRVYRIASFLGSLGSGALVIELRESLV